MSSIQIKQEKVSIFDENQSIANLNWIQYRKLESNLQKMKYRRLTYPM